jgi:Prokaryotic membrane lipoprotein lipid attachment site
MTPVGSGVVRLGLFGLVDRSVPSVMPRRLRRLFLAALAVAVLAGCSTSNDPKDYNADVKDNFTTTCIEANREKSDVPNVEEFCGCAYDKISTGFSFDEFKSLDETLQDKLDDEATAPKNAAEVALINSRYVELVESCRVSGPAAPSATTSTTAAK